MTPRVRAFIEARKSLPEEVAEVADSLHDMGLSGKLFKIKKSLKISCIQRTFRFWCNRFFGK
jgi:hypothetical protein